MKNNRIQKRIGFFYMIRKIYPMHFRASPLYSVMVQCVNVLTGMANGAILLFTQWFFDTALRVSNSESTLRTVLLVLGIFVCLRLFTNVLESIRQYLVEVNNARVMEHMMGEIHRKSAEIDPILYEDPAYLDDIDKAANGVDSAIYFQYVTSSILTFHLPYFLFLSVYLTELHPMLVLCLLFVFIPVLISHLFRSSLYAKLEDASAPIRRQTAAYADACSGKRFYKETRTLGAFGYFRQLLKDSVEALNTAVWKTQKKAAMLDFGFQTLHLFGYIGVFGLAFLLMLRGAISIGAFAAVFAAIDTMFASMAYLIGDHIGSITDGMGEIRNFLRFLEITPAVRESQCLDKKSVICLQNVSFRYPNANVDSLRNIHLQIQPGETIAIVGENGAGKSTLVKLIMGLYAPSTGTVQYGDVDIKHVSYSALFTRMSGVFQKYAKYALSLRDNVAISDFDSMESDAEIEKVLRKVHVNQDDTGIFPEGLHTMLSREFDGVELSGGQWQRIAIARGMYRDSDLIILDEPTAAIDPIEESLVYEEFARMTEGKTAVIVTHRIGSAKIANRIVVMQDGGIAEVGTHAQLLANHGVYADMYEAQAKWY